MIILQDLFYPVYKELGEPTLRKIYKICTKGSRQQK